MKRLNTALLSLLLLMSVLLSACGALPQSGGSSATLDSSSAILLKLRIYSATSPRVPRISTRTV